jgi:hypothetical protein
MLFHELIKVLCYQINTMKTKKRWVSRMDYSHAYLMDISLHGTSFNNQFHPYNCFLEVFLSFEFVYNSQLFSQLNKS